MKTTIELTPQEVIAVLKNGSLETFVKSVPWETTEQAVIADKKEEESKKEEDPKKYSKQDLLNLFRKKNSPENRELLKDILTATGAKSVSSIPEEKYAEVIEQLNAIEDQYGTRSFKPIKRRTMAPLHTVRKA